METVIALGGGGARGAAHIGVLRVVERSGFQIRGIAGTSIGAIVAALYASGKTPDQIEEIFSSVDQSKLYGWPLMDGPGLLGTKGIQEFLKQHFGDKTFRDLKIPCAIVAVDLTSSREIIFQDGSIIDAVLGSIAVPGLFPPRIYNNYRLIDGGILDPVPVRAARNLNPGLPVFAVTLTNPLDVPSSPLGIISITSTLPLVKQFSRMNITQAFQVFADSIDITSRQMAELRLVLDKPEIIIRPDVQNINLLDKVNVHEIALRGEIAAFNALAKYKRSAADFFSQIFQRIFGRE